MLFTSFQHLCFLLFFINIEATEAELNLTFIEEQPVDSLNQKDLPIKLHCISKCQDELSIVTKHKDFVYPLFLIEKTNPRITQLLIGELTIPGNTSSFIETDFLSIDVYGTVQLEKLFNQSKQPLEIAIKACDENIKECSYVTRSLAMMDFKYFKPQFVSPCPQFVTINKDISLNTVLSQIEVISFQNSRSNAYHIMSLKVLDKKHFVDHVILQLAVKAENSVGNSVCGLEVKINQN